MSESYNERLLSLDLFRGITMLLLLAEGTNLYYFLNVAVPEKSIFHYLTAQFYHAKWQGMHFWDLIQPYFTFIVGFAMAFSLKKRWERGETWLGTLKHILFRCGILFLIGIILQSGYRGNLVWELWNILTQLSISIFITFMVFRLPNSIQLLISFCLLIITEMLYRYFSMEGFNQPFVIHHNFGTFIDLALMGKTHPDGWVAFNCVPTTAHVIWGGLAGSIVRANSNSTKVIKILGLAGFIGLIIGYGMDLIGLSPIIKHISTGSFVVASGGWCVLSFIFLYWLVDVKSYNRWVSVFTIVGLNPIFIYVFSRTVGRSFLNEFVPVFTKGFMGWFGISEGLMNFSTYMAILGIEWYLCYWLYKRKIVIKI